jgi:hypothetical protein
MTCACGKQIRVPDELVGRRVKCPGCGDPVDVPAPAKAAARTVAPSRPAPARKPAPANEDGPVEKGVPALIRFECECGKALQAKAEHAGKKIRCPACQELVTVPSGPDDDDQDQDDRKARISTQKSSKPAKPLGKAARKQDDDDDLDDLDELDQLDEEGEDDRPRRKGKGKQKAKSGLWMWVGIAAGVLLLVGGGIGAWLMFRGGSSSADLALVPANAQLFVSVRLGDLWETNLVKDVMNQLPKEAKDELSQTEKKVGLTAADIERVTFVGQDIEKKSMWIIVATKNGYDQKKILELMGPGVKEKQEKGKTYHFKDDTGVHFLDQKILVFGSELGLKACFDQIDKPKTDGALSKSLKEANKKHHLVGGFAVPPEQMAQGKQLLQMNKQAAPFLPLLELQGGTFTADLNGKELAVELSFAFPDDKKAGAAKKALDDLKSIANLGIMMVKGQNPEAGDAVEKALNSLTINQKGTDVVVAMKGEIPAKALGGDLIGQLMRVGPGPGPGGGVAEVQTTNNLKQLMLAMIIYHDQHGAFPPAVIYSKDGKNQPLYSWRVELLPYLEQQALYNEFRKDEPWNSPNNINLANKMPSVFLLPGEANTGTTHYQVFTGPNTAFPGTKKLRLGADFLAGTSNTIGIVEAAAPVKWTQPVDQTLQPGNPAFQLLWGAKQTSHVALCDGSVKTIKRTISAKTLRERINPGSLEAPGPDW